ncbi:leucyl/phenylalanyl-tRNA--protein transferase [Thorsellia kenyensis]|uniref:Leucyl/phenylalanyl-tRNA--protein transferase n=1 Tax=Thorsellia kenyensis TaxID=1549888 RepID=A0ABV6C915_9GAMM
MHKRLLLLSHIDNLPDPNSALEEPNGLVAISEQLTLKHLKKAYSTGIFPWYSEGEPVMWWSPDPRAVLFVHDYKPNKRFIRFLKASHWRVTFNHAFEQVVRQCAVREEGTWISAEIIKYYTALAKKGMASSVEVWDDEQLIGGLYGIHQGKVFCGESMFSIKSNASKVAFHSMVQEFKLLGGELIDCQILNPHTESLGAIEIPRSEFLYYLKMYQNQDVRF